jgi:hypothetical protein
MKDIARESIRSVYGNIDPNKKDNTFEVDFSPLIFTIIDFGFRLYDR